MARRTKAEAEQTRHALLDAAERLFQERGVSRTTLQDIATAAGTTRGAIYWHFHDKADLFNAMMDRVTLPLERTFTELSACDDRDPEALLRQLMDALVSALRATVHDPQTGRVFEIATHKVEYVNDMQPVVQRCNEAMGQFRLHIQDVLGRAAARRGLVLPMPVADAALGLTTLFDGLLVGWLRDRRAFDLLTVGEAALRCYLQGLGLPVPASTGVEPATAA